MTVALFALHPFSHLYGSFFFGVSEASTTILAVVALFDAEHGVPELERAERRVRPQGVFVRPRRASWLVHFVSTPRRAPSASQCVDSSTGAERRPTAPALMPRRASSAGRPRPY